MDATRRSLTAAGLALALTGCGRRSGPVGPRDVLAAGQPAALLVWSLTPGRLLGWPRRPSPAALRALPSQADLPQLGALTGGGPPAGVEAAAALRPRLIIDYGDVDAEHRALGERLGRRLGADWRLIDGALARIPEAFRQAGALLGVERNGEALAALAARTLDLWRAAPAGPSFYYARGADGLETAFRGALATEVLEGAGWTNVAVDGRHIGRVSREQAVAWDPEAIVTLDPRLAETFRADPLWRRRRDGSRRRLLLLPDRPFGWIDRPPSVNRLLGCAWLADPAGSPLRLARLSHALYGRGPAATPRPRWLP
jgi:iron complex transport system substrate-binding protein